MEHLDHPSPPFQWCQNGFFAPSRLYHWFGGGGGGRGWRSLFHFILSKIVVPRSVYTRRRFSQGKTKIFGRLWCYFQFVLIWSLVDTCPTNFSHEGTAILFGAGGGWTTPRDFSLQFGRPVWIRGTRSRTTLVPAKRMFCKMGLHEGTCPQNLPQELELSRVPTVWPNFLKASCARLYEILSWQCYSN